MENTTTTYTWQEDFIPGEFYDFEGGSIPGEESPISDYLLSYLEKIESYRKNIMIAALLVFISVLVSFIYFIVSFYALSVNIPLYQANTGIKFFMHSHSNDPKWDHATHIGYVQL